MTEQVIVPTIDTASVPAEHSLPTRVVDHVTDRQFMAVAGDGSLLPMRQAVSCLVTPIAGDHVLTAQAGGETYILAILQRAAGTDVARLRIETDGEIEFVARRISFQTSVLDVFSQAVTMMGDAYNTLFHRSKRVIGNETVIAKSTTLRAGERVSVIAHADVQQAGVLSQTVDGPLSINTHTTVLTADADIRLNGERINVG